SGPCLDNPGFILRGLWRIPYGSDSLSDGGAGTDALPQRYSRLARPAERPLLPQGARVVWWLECGPLRLTCRSRCRRHTRDTKVTVRNPGAPRPSWVGVRLVEGERVGFIAGGHV